MNQPNVDMVFINYVKHTHVTVNAIQENLITNMEELIVCHI